MFLTRIFKVLNFHLRHPFCLFSLMHHLSLFSPSQVFFTCIHLSISPLLFQGWHFSVPVLQSLHRSCGQSTFYFQWLLKNTGLCQPIDGLLPISGNGSQVGIWDIRDLLLGALEEVISVQDVAVFVYEAQNCCSHFFTSQRLSRAFHKSRVKRISETRILSYDWTTADLCPTSGILTSYVSLNKLFNVVLAAWLR